MRHFFFGVGALSKTPGPQATLTQWCRQFHCGLRRQWGDRFDLVSVALRWFGSPVSCVWVKNHSKYILKVVPPWVMFVGLLVYIPQYMTISWTVPPYTNSPHNPDHKKKHKHDGPKMPLRSWVGTFCQSTNPQRSWVFHSMNPIVHKEVGFVYTLTGKGQWEFSSVYWKIPGNSAQRLRLCTILSSQRKPTK